MRRSGQPPNLIIDNVKPSIINNKVEFYNSIKISITTGDIEAGWGRQILKGIRSNQPPITPNTNRKRNISHSPNTIDNALPGPSNINNNTDTGDSAEGIWIAPTKTARNKKKKKLYVSSPTSTANAYTSLSDLETDAMELSEVFHTPNATNNSIINNPNKNNNKNKKNNNTNTRTPTDSNKKPNFTKGNKGTTAIIEIWNATIKETVKQFTDINLTQDDFVINSKNPDRIIIKPKTAESLEKIKTALEGTDNWYTYTPLKLKPKNLILKRVFEDYNEQDVKTYIDNLKLPNINVLKVIKYNYDKSNPKHYHFIVQLDHSSIARDLMAEPFICYQQVAWDWFRRNKIFQCRKCQRVGHASMNCHFTRRCVKWGQAHGKDECQIPKNADRNLLICVNCKGTGHPASYYGCPYLKYAQNQLDIQKNTNKNNFQKK